MNETITILYVEDDVISRNAVSAILEEYFDRIIVASDGEEALTLFNQNSIDILITDIGLPKIDGMELVRRIRSDVLDLPIIITSAYDDQEFLLEGITSQVSGYFIKPLKLSKLISAVEKLVEKIRTDRRKEKEKILLAQYKVMVDQSSMVIRTDLQGRIDYVNDYVCTVTGYIQEELVGKMYQIGDGNTWSDNLFLKILQLIQESHKPWHGVIRNQTKTKKDYYVQTTITPIFSLAHRIEEFIISQTVITETIHPKQKFMDYLESLGAAYVVLIKIENFKYFETTLFQGITKKIEEEFANKIFLRLPEACAFSRIFVLESGEFALIQNVDTLPREAPHVTEKLYTLHQRINNEEIQLGGVDYSFSILMSIAYGQNALDDAKVGLEQLVDSTKSFMLANGLTKENGKRVEQLQFLQKAVENYNVISYFQPIVNNKTQKIEKYESLVRFIDENENIFSPYTFLELSKTGKYYDQITSIVLENSFDALEKTDFYIGINLSALDLEKELTQKKFLSLLKLNEYRADRVVLEITEDENIEDFESIKQFIHQVKAYGVQIAIDDFGVGYSSFERILDFEPNILKIDGKLIRNIHQDTLAYSMVESLVSFAKKENLITIAEFVENEEIYKTLCEIGVDFSQGYYFGKPDRLT